MFETGSLRILIAEDDYLISKEISSVISGLGHQTIGVAADGEQAVAMTQELAPDLVMMDIQMPVMDGLSAARAIREQCPTAIIVLTAHDSPTLIDEASNVGVGAYLTKPPSAGPTRRAIAIAHARFDDVKRLRLAKEQVEQALARVKTLSEVVPICASCKKARDDRGAWAQIEDYLAQRIDATFSHGLCPECVTVLYPDET